MSNTWRFIEDNTRAIITAVFVFFVVIMMLSLAITALTITLDRDEFDTSYYRAVTPGMRIFVGECLDEGYSFGQCYSKYVDAVEYGSIMLEMPTRVA